MTDHQFSTLSADLRTLAGQIPLHWGNRAIYNVFCSNAKNIQFYHTHGVNAGVVFILERQKGVAEGVIYGM